MIRPTICRLVIYTLTRLDADAVNRRRTTGTQVRRKLTDGEWVEGTQAHIGSNVSEGDRFPLLIIRVWPNEFGPDIDGVDGQVFLGGNDVFWVTSVRAGTEPGTWAWPGHAEL